MKRSRSVALTLMMSTAAISLAGCDAPDTGPKEVAFTSLSQCIDSGAPTDVCATSYENALAAHAAQATQYKSVEECQAASDSDCRPTQVRNSDGSMSNVIVPMMAGYMISQALNRGAGGGYVGTPIYSSRSNPGSYRGLATTPSVKGSAPAPTYKSLPSPNVKTATISRGGFGGFGRSASS